MSRFSDANVVVAHDIVSHYPRKKSAVIPLLHLAQEQDGYVTEEAMQHIAELTDTTPAEVLGTGSFYEMFKFHPVGRYVINLCTNIACQLVGGEELLHHAEKTLGIRSGGVTDDGLFTIEDVECIAACTEAPCFQVNYRYFHRMTTDDFDAVIDDLRSGRPVLDRGRSGDSGEIPAHGTLARTRQRIPTVRSAGIVPPEEANAAPVWLRRNGDGEETTDG